MEFPRYVGAGEDGDNAVDGFRSAGIDPQHVGPGVVGEAERPVEEALGPDVVHVAPFTEGEFDALVLRSGLADPIGQGRRRDVAGGEYLDRLEDLRVAGAAAEVPAEATGGGLVVEIGALLVDQGFGTHQDTGRAEPALECTGGSEGVGQSSSLCLLETLEGRDGLAFHLLHRDETTLYCLAVNEDGARPALAGRRASVLGGRHPKFLAQGGEEVRVVRRDLDRESIDVERSGFHG